jgi:hypothetical protein
MQTTTPERELITYREAAQWLDLSADYVAHLVSSGILHPVKLQGERQKYLHRDEVEWYGRRRSGSLDPNPYAAKTQQESGPQTAPPAPTVDLSELGRLAPQLNLLDTGGMSLGAGIILFVILLAALLGSYLTQRRFDEEKLTQFRTAPQLQSWRRAIKRLAEQLPDEPAA